MPPRWERARILLTLLVAATAIAYALWPHGAPAALGWLIVALIVTLWAVVLLRPRRRWWR
jgi:hypothetical protein